MNKRASTDSPDSTLDQGQPVLSSRRNILAAMALSVAGLATPEAREKSEQEDLRVYEHGETIELTPAIKISIEGWRLRIAINHEELRKDLHSLLEDYIRKHPGRREVDVWHWTLSLVSSRKQESNYVLDLPVNPENFLYDIDKPFTEIERPMLPDGDDDSAYLLAMLTQSRSLLKTQHFQIKFGINEYSVEPPVQSKIEPLLRGKPPKTSIYSEFPLDPKLAKDLTGMVSGFDKFLGETAPVYVRKTPAESSIMFSEADTQSGVYDPRRGRIVLSIDAILARQRDGLSLMSMYHELTHGITERIKKDPTQNFELFQAYSKLIEAMRCDPPRIRIEERNPLFGVGEYSPYFQVFDESSYLEGKDSRAGHPYDNHDELFASAMTVFRFFPAEFIRRLHELPLQQRTTIAEVGEKILTVLRNVPHIRQKHIRDILPSLPDLEKVISQIRQPEPASG